MAGFKPVLSIVKPRTMMATHPMPIVRNSERKGSTRYTMTPYDERIRLESVLRADAFR